MIPPKSAKKAPALRRFFEGAVQGRVEQVTLKEVKVEVNRFLRQVGTQEERDHEARQLISLVGMTLLVGESVWAVKKGLLSPVGSLGKATKLGYYSVF